MASPDPARGLATLLRRLASIAYDLLVLPAVLLAQGRLQVYPGRALFQGYLLWVAFVFFGGFWVHGGQTPGMRAWRLQLTNRDGTGISWKQARRRFAGALLSWLPAGLGYLWILIDREGLAWHDRISGTELRLLQKK